MKKTIFAVICFCMVIVLMLVGCDTQNVAGSSEDTEAAQSDQKETTAEVNEASETDETDSESSTPDVSDDAGIKSIGPNGETAVSADTIKLTDEEIQQVKDGGYTAAIVMHITNSDWAAGQIKGIKETFETFGIEVVAITDAEYKPEKQVSDLESVLALNPDIVISLPIDPVAESEAYKKAAEKGVKIVFMDDCVRNATAGEDYVSVVSADSYGNGAVAADIMADLLGGKGTAAYLFHDGNLLVTKMRSDGFAERMKEKYPDIEIVDAVGFPELSGQQPFADALLAKNPDVDAVFAPWAEVAECVVAAAKAVGRDDLIVTTVDLGSNVAKMIAEDGIVKGLGAQLPYHQGVAEATLAAYALLEKECPPFVAVPAYAVTRDNILDGYEYVFHSDPPKELVDAYNSAE